MKTYLNIEENHCLNLCKVDAKCVGGQHNFFEDICSLIETFTQDYSGTYVPYKGYTTFLKVSATTQKLLGRDERNFVGTINNYVAEKIDERLNVFKGECVAGQTPYEEDEGFSGYWLFLIIPCVILACFLCFRFCLLVREKVNTQKIPLESEISQNNVSNSKTICWLLMKG